MVSFSNFVKYLELLKNDENLDKSNINPHLSVCKSSQCTFETRDCIGFLIKKKKKN